jgi:outer membrane protein assembly factor BamE (lipoprotein component of BamABCDE complex)
VQRILIAGILVWACGVARGQDSPPLDPRPLDPRVDQLTTETAQLRRIIADQERRIAALEKTVKALQAATASPVPKRIPSPTPEWRVAANWAHIKKGMSEAQVVDLLGPPTRVISVVDTRTLYYQPDAKTGGTPNGSVTLMDDRVTALAPPDF